MRFTEQRVVKSGLGEGQGWERSGGNGGSVVICSQLRVRAFPLHSD